MPEKKSIISELISLSKVDGVVADDEVALIRTLGEMIGLSDREILDVFRNPAPFTPPQAPMDRILQFHRLVLLMNIDGEVNPKEIQHLKFAGIKLGLDADAAEEVLVKMQEYENNLIPPDALLAIFTKHLN